MVDSHDILLLGVGLLIGIGFATLLILVHNMPSNSTPNVVAPNYVQAPSLIQKPESLGG